MNAVYTNLDTPKRYLMFQLDEVIGISAGAMIGLLVFHGGLMMFISAIGVMIGIRSVKKKKPPQFWLHLMYACLPRFVSRLWFNAFPDYANQHYLT